MAIKMVHNGKALQCGVDEHAQKECRAMELGVCAATAPCTHHAMPAAKPCVVVVVVVVVV